MAQQQCTEVQFLAHFTVAFRTVSGREGPPERSCGITTPEGDAIRRVIYDNSGKPYFGYQFRIADAGAKQFRVEVLPVKDSPLLSFSKSPQPVVVGADEFVDVTVLERLSSGAHRMGPLEWLLTLLGWGEGDPPASTGRMTDYLRIVPKARRPFEQRHEAILDDVFSRGGILQHPTGEAIHRVAMARPKSAKSAFVAARSQHDKLLFSIIHDSGLARRPEKIRVPQFFLGGMQPRDCYVHERS